MTPFGVLIAMAEGRQRHEWQMQSRLMALVARGLGDREAKTSDFDPFAAHEAEAVDEISMSDLRITLRGTR